MFLLDALDISELPFKQRGVGSNPARLTFFRQEFNHLRGSPRGDLRPLGSGAGLVPVWRRDFPAFRGLSCWTAASRCAGERCAYRCVIWIVLCSINSCTVARSTPAMTSRWSPAASDGRAPVQNSRCTNAWYGGWTRLRSVAPGRSAERPKRFVLNHARIASRCASISHPRYRLRRFIARKHAPVGEGERRGAVGFVGRGAFEVLSHAASSRRARYSH